MFAAMLRHDPLELFKLPGVEFRLMRRLFLEAEVADPFAVE